jgi:glutamine amidotransferase
VSQTIGVVDYQAGNLASVGHALRAACSGGENICFVDRAEQLDACDRLILPGVGTFGGCRSQLDAQGLTEALGRYVHALARPLLGICVGMQLFASTGEEKGSHKGLGWIDGCVRKLDHLAQPPRLPHMGWNQVQWTEQARSHSVTQDLNDEDAVYFVHSYAFDNVTPSLVLGHADYGGHFTAAIGRDNLIGVQFHPEKSQKVGQQLLRAFLHWKP